MRATYKATPAFSILAGGILTAASVVAQVYPIKPIRLIVPFPPGGGADITARTLAPKVAEAFKQSVVVDNRHGAAGAIGTEIAVRANPDGYTLLIIATSYATNAALNKLPYDPVNDVVPIALIGETGNLMALHPSVPATSIKELIAYDKVNPGKLNYGSTGTGGYSHLASELFNQMSGTKLTHVPYKGTGPALNDLIGGQIQILIGGTPSMTPQVKSNRVRGIAVTTIKRSNAMPNIPTVSEVLPGYEAVNWYAALGPKDIPKNIVARWNNEITRILQLPDMKERMAANGIEPVGGLPEHFAEVLKRDVAKWQKVVKIANIKPEG